MCFRHYSHIVNQQTTTLGNTRIAHSFLCVRVWGIILSQYGKLCIVSAGSCELPLANTHLRISNNVFLLEITKGSLQQNKYIDGDDDNISRTVSSFWMPKLRSQSCCANEDGRNFCTYIYIYIYIFHTLDNECYKLVSKLH